MWTGWRLRSVGEPGLSTHRCWKRSTWGTCVAVDDRLAVLEPCREPSLSPDARAGVVHHPDPQVSHLHHLLLQ